MIVHQAALLACIEGLYAIPIYEALTQDDKFKKNQDKDTAGDTVIFFLIYYIYEKLHQQI